MPGLVPGIHVFKTLRTKDVDGRAFARRRVSRHGYGGGRYGPQAARARPWRI